MSLLTWYAILFVPQLLIGAAIGWWAARRSNQRESAASADAINEQEQTLRNAMSVLQQLTSSVKDDVREHASKVDSSSQALSALSAEDDTNAALESIAPILEANEQLQQRLAQAEKKLAEQSQQLDKQSMEARTDPLTGILNRRGLEEELAERTAQYDQGEEPLSVIILDVDHFKQFNDQYGHDVGDVVLREVARVTSGAVRTNDVVGRYGGEEFVVLLPKTALHQARPVAENVRIAVEQNLIDDEAGQLKVTVSLGVAQAVIEDPAALLKRADVALYAAKENGRNCAWYHDGLNCQPIARKVLPSADGRSDELTQLPSRHALEEEASRRLAEAARYGNQLSVIVLEIDQVGEVSATRGQEVVHLMLRGMARFLTDLMRDMDLVARNGDAGFAILLPGCALSDAARVAERVRCAVKKSPFPGEEEFHLSISAGVVGGRPEESADVLMARAERALRWCSKSDGDCIYVDQDEEEGLAWQAEAAEPAPAAVMA